MIGAQRKSQKPMNDAIQDLEWETNLLCYIVAGKYLGLGAVSLPYWSITCRQTPYDELPKCQTAETYIRACTLISEPLSICWRNLQILPVLYPWVLIANMC